MEKCCQADSRIILKEALKNDYIKLKVNDIVFLFFSSTHNIGKILLSVLIIILIFLEETF